MNKLLALGLLLFTLPAISALDFMPSCVYEETPSFGGWQESWDTNNKQSYCLFTTNDTGSDITRIYIHQEPFGGVTHQGSFDFWKSTTYTQATGNIRNVNITFKYYYPSFNGQCLAQTPSPATIGGYLTPQAVFVTNADVDFNINGNFNAAFRQFNNEIVCDQERVFTHKLTDFENEFGSSFTGNSKQIRRVDFETSMMYVWDIKIVGVTTEQVW
jgi:hypothetical protein